MMSTNPYESPTTKGTNSFSLLALLWSWFKPWSILLAVLFVMVLLALPLLRRPLATREVFREKTCQNNLKQIALALIAYETEHHSLPPAFTVDAAGKPLHSWRTLILPYLGEKELYDTIDLTKPWDASQNIVAHNSRPEVYECTLMPAHSGLTTYLAATGPESCFPGATSRTMAEISNDHSLTLMVVDVNPKQAVHWMSPTDANDELILSLRGVKDRPHPNGFPAAFVKGNVELLPKHTSAVKLQAMMSIAGGEDYETNAAD